MSSIGPPETPTTHGKPATAEPTVSRKSYRYSGSLSQAHCKLLTMQQTEISQDHGDFRRRNKGEQQLVPGRTENQ